MLASFPYYLVYFKALVNPEKMQMPIKDFHTIQSISKQFYFFMKTFIYDEFPYYLVYFKACKDNERYVVRFYFHTIQSISKLQFYPLLCCHLRYFHTIQSISKPADKALLLETVYEFPYYLVYFKAFISCAGPHTQKTYFHTIQSISKPKTLPPTRLSATSFPYYLVYFKAGIHGPEKKYIKPDFHTIQSISKPQLMIIFHSNLSNFHTIQSISKQPTGRPI